MKRVLEWTLPSVWKHEEDTVSTTSLTTATTASSTQHSTGTDGKTEPSRTSPTPLSDGNRSPPSSPLTVDHDDRHRQQRERLRQQQQQQTGVYTDKDPLTEQCVTDGCSFMSAEHIRSRNVNWGESIKSHDPLFYRHSRPPELQQIAEELNKLSVNEREQVFEEIHGVAQEYKEIPEKVQVSITKMNNRIKKMKSHERTAYEKACFLNPGYIKSTAFQLMFLRSEQFHPVKAAFRMVNFFQKKLELFGPELLAKNVTFQDLDPETQQCVLRTEGACMYNRMKDSVGRAYFLHRFVQEVESDRDKDKLVVPAKRHNKALWYMIMTCLTNDECTQKRGANLVACTIGTTPRDFMTMLNVQKYTADIVQTLPIRFTASHICVENQQARPLVKLLTTFFPENVRVRTKMHYGSSMECGYSLQTFGIDRSVFPLDDRGWLRKDYIQTWIRDLQEKEAIQKQQKRQNWPLAAIEFPKETDVLLGRGMPFQNHPGTVAMMQAIQALSDGYIACQTRMDKKSFTEKLVHDLKAKGVRFLERHPSNEYWLEVDDGKAHEKVAMGFRNRTRDAKKKPGSP